ncbi:MAG TPA: HEAT repeat domain-containing protein, partial [Lacipirellulaceae bacterium]|nr:HEAT repeat domain-containing protein [Lacipirellulaceae bacterium]
MAGSLQTTIETLGRSRNDAATGTLLAALPTASGAIVDQIIRALVRRTSKQGHVAVLARWPQMGAELRSAVLANQGRMGGALREALLSDNDQMFANACDVARESGEYDLAPTLITVAEQPSGQRREAATTLVVGLAERLLRPFDEEEVAGFSRHPETIRQGVLESLQRSVERFAAHGNRALVEAFVILAGPDNPSLRTILQAPRHTCHETIVDILEESQNPEVLKLLTAFLIGAEAPPAVRSIVARRTDDPFVATLLELPLSPASMALEKNLACIHGLACLASAAAICQRCSPEKQAAAMRLMSYSGAAEEAKLEFAATLLSRGAPQARLAACECLALIAGQRANELILAALDDPEGEVQAAATRQLRQRHIPGTLARLIELASSPHAAVQAAARDSLTEFSFENFLARYETLDDDARRQTASLVALV